MFDNADSFFQNIEKILGYAERFQKLVAQAKGLEGGDHGVPGQTLESPSGHAPNPTRHGPRQAEAPREQVGDDRGALSTPMERPVIMEKVTPLMIYAALLGLLAKLPEDGTVGEALALAQIKPETRMIDMLALARDKKDFLLAVIGSQL